MHVHYDGAVKDRTSFKLFLKQNLSLGLSDVSLVNLHSASKTCAHMHTVCCRALHEHTFRRCSQSSQQSVLRQVSPNLWHCVCQYTGSNIPMFKNNPLFPSTIYVLVVPWRWRKQVSQNIVMYLPQRMASISENCNLKNIKILTQSIGKFEVMWQQDKHSQ